MYLVGWTASILLYPILGYLELLFVAFLGG